MVSATTIRTLSLLLLLAYPALIFPHGVGMDLDRQEAQIISLHHDDETPLAGAGYELFAAGADLPYQSGRTDAGAGWYSCPEISGSGDCGSSARTGMVWTGSSS
ncbi:MAG: hypothetical protein AB2588_15560 [Candidatus Thiodiazotropha sp.]